MGSMTGRLLATTAALVLFVAPLAAQSQDETDRLPPLPDTNPPPEARQFDYLLGEWTFEAQTKNPRVPSTYEGRWSARPAFDGFGVIDEWRIVTPQGATAYLGTTARVFDRSSGTWRLQFVNIYTGRWSTQHAVYRDGEMHLWWEDEDPDGPFLARVRYHDIQDDSFRWRMDRSYDGGATWIENYLTMEVTRSGAAASR